MEATDAAPDLKTLPPNKVTLVQRNGKNYYVYADPALPREDS